MWMIDNDYEQFLTKNDIVGYAATLLKKARADNNLTLIVGNGPSQSAAWLHGERMSASGIAQEDNASVSWESVVKEAAKKADVEEDLIKKSKNNLALAQAVLVGYEKKGIDNEDEVRSDLVSSLNQAFSQPIEPTAIDEMLVALKPRDIVTTNYDFQLERAFKHYQCDWKAFVHHNSGRFDNDRSTWIHKMHGSFMPAQEDKCSYLFSSEFLPNADSSIVITESDYDRCYRQLSNADLKTYPIFEALSKTCLIIGKSLDLQDISFMYALRKTRKIRKKTRQHIFMLCNTPPSLEEQLTLFNLEIIPLVINLPKMPQSGHFYYGVLAALARIFPDDLATIYECSKSDSYANFLSLVRHPHMVAIGLAAKNIVGRTTYNGKNAVPPPGRRNLRYEGTEEHVGGSAMTPLLVNSALNHGNRFQLSLVSSIGNAEDTYSHEILHKASACGIDTDAVSRNRPASWYSTVLVHTCKTHDDKDYPGQRIFLDRGYEDRVKLDPYEESQFAAQISQPDLKLLFLDKFLANQYPRPEGPSNLDSDLYGFLIQKQNIKLLEKTVGENPGLDIVYETGGGGSAYQHVEHELKPYINIFTSGFPFFANVILKKSGITLSKALKKFAQEDWAKSDFNIETDAIESLLGAYPVNNPVSGTSRVFEIPLPAEIIGEAQKWVGRNSLVKGRSRRWFITTLHHYGAIGMDFTSQKAWYCRIPDIDGSNVENTAGAGDSFRGGLTYFLLNSDSRCENELPRALWFSTKVASGRCQYFRMDDACEHLQERSQEWYERSQQIEIR